MNPPRHAPVDAAGPAPRVNGSPPPWRCRRACPNDPGARSTSTSAAPPRPSWSTRDMLWYHVNKTDLVRLVIVRDPDGVEPDDYFFTTDPNTSAADVVSRYAARWAIEVCFRDVKQDLGGQNPQSWKRKGPERAAALSLWLHATIWCWYLTTHPTGRTWTPRPWYRP